MENLITKVKHKVNDYFPLFSADPPNIILAKADSGASSHYFKPSDRTDLSALRSTPFEPTVMLPDSTNIQATHAGLLPLNSSLSTTAKTAHILDGMTNSSLISIGQLCDDDCVAVLDKRKLQVFKRNACVLSGTRNRIDGLWDIALPISRPTSTSRPKAPLQLNAIIRKDIIKTNLVQYLYGCLGSPVVSTWKLAIANGNFITWPGIDTILTRQSEIIRSCVSFWKLRFQQDSTCSTGNQSRRSLKARSTSLLGLSRRRRLVCWPFHGTLPLR
jgi:hypothetical protein